MASSLDSTLLAEMQGQDRTNYVFELTLAGVEYRFAKTDEPVASESKGNYLPRVKRFGPIPRTVSFPSLGLQNPRSTVSIVDEDRVLQKAIGGPASGEILGAVAKIVLRTDETTAVNHYEVLNGVVKDFSSNGRDWTFTIGPDNSRLTSKLKIPRLTREDWPNIPSSNVGKVGQMVVGDQSSGGITDAAGVIQAYLVDTVNDYWYVSFGHLLALSNSYPSVAGLTSGNFALKHLAINGRPYTVAEQISGATTQTIDDDLKVDAQGIDVAGDATGAILSNPGITLETLLVNIAFNEYPIGATLGANPDATSWLWLSSVGERVNSTYFANIDTLLGYTNHKTGFVLNSDMTARDMITEWVRSFKVPIFWDDQLRISGKGFDLGVRTPYQTVFLKNDPRIGIVKSKTHSENRFSRYTLNWGKSEVGGGFGRSHIIANEDLTLVSEGSLDMPYGKRIVI